MNTQTIFIDFIHHYRSKHVAGSSNSKYSHGENSDRDWHIVALKYGRHWSSSIVSRTSWAHLRIKTDYPLPWGSNTFFPYGEADCLTIPYTKKNQFNSRIIINAKKKQPPSENSVFEKAIIKWVLKPQILLYTASFLAKKLRHHFYHWCQAIAIVWWYRVLL